MPFLEVSVGKDGITRLPRPKGLTMMAQHYHQAQDPTTTQKHKKTIINHIIRLYILQGYTLNGKGLNMYELGYYLGVTPKRLTKYMAKQTQELSGITGTGDGLKDTLGLISTLLVQNSLQTRALVTGQVHRLLNAQGDGYKPFISAEVNKALNLMIGTDKSLSDVLKTLAGPQTLVQINQTHIEGDNVEGDKNVEYITVDKAINLVTEGHDPFNPKQIEAMSAPYLPEGTPEVNAMRQEGIDDGSKVLMAPSLPEPEDK